MIQQATATDIFANRSGRWLLVLLVLFAAAWLATLGARRLLDPDEGRYAEIPREMVTSGDWLTPRLNDLKYFEKPALQYWATAVAYKTFGIEEFTSRLWCGLTGLAGVLLAGWAGARLFGRTSGIIAAAVLGSSLMWVVLGHLNTLDMGLSFFLEASIFAFLFAQQAPVHSNSERNWMLVAWAMAALAVLSKGLEAVVLPGLTLVVYTIIERELSAWKRLHVIAGSVIFFVIAAPWFIAMSIVNPEFPHFFFIHEHFERFLTDVHARVQPWWYFIPLLIAGALPWTSLAIHGLRGQWQMDDSTGFRPRRFLIVWIAIVVVFFSASQSKMAPYILPVMPALALLVGDIATRLRPQLLQRHLLGVAILWALAMAYAVFGPLPDIRHAPTSVVAQLFSWLAWSFMLMSIAAIGGWYLAKKQHVLQAMIAFGLGTLAGLSVLLIGANVASTTDSGYNLAQAIKLHINADHSAANPFYSIDDYDQTLPFYLRRAVTMVGYRGELDFGLTQEPAKGLPDRAAFISAWTKDPSGSIAVMPHATFAALTDAGVPMNVIGRDFKSTAVMKP